MGRRYEQFVRWMNGWRLSFESNPNRSVRWALTGLLLIHVTMLAYGAYQHGPAWDEVGHLPAGISHWQLGNTDLYRVNPPLVRTIATLPLSGRDFDLTWMWNEGGAFARPEWSMGSQLWHRDAAAAQLCLTIARWSCILLSLLCAFVIFRWSESLYGPGAGLLSASLWCFSPLVLTNAELMTPDVGAAAFGIAASYAFAKWLKTPGMSETLEAAVWLGLAELTKFTWIVLFLLWPAMWVGICVFRREPERQRRFRAEGAAMIGILTLAILIINFGYGFEGTFERLGEYRFVSRTLKQADAETAYYKRGNRFQETLLDGMPVPLPRNYVQGIDRQKLDFEMKLSSYLGGQWRDGGWWYYYVYGLGVKEPLGYLVLFLLSLVVGWKRRDDWQQWALLLPAITVFVLVSSQTGFNHHLRYVLPCFPMVFVWMGQLWPELSVKRFGTVTLGVFLGSAIVASLWVYPHSHAYFNVIAGGPLGGPRHLLNSNIDWGQDVTLLAKWIDEHPEKPFNGITYTLDGLFERQDMGLSEGVPPRGYLGSMISEEVRRVHGPQPGNYAVFVSALHERDGRYEYFREFTPKHILGYTVFIYELSADDVDAYWLGRLEQRAPRGEHHGVRSWQDPPKSRGR